MSFRPLHIVKSNPKIRQVFDSWIVQGKDEKDLWSELSKNEQLKNIIIEETPWLADAEDDASKKQRIAMLFDVNVMSDRLSTAVASLAKLQLADGSWPWFKGMTSSTYITLRIMESLARPLDIWLLKLPGVMTVFLKTRTLTYLRI